MSEHVLNSDQMISQLKEKFQLMLLTTKAKKVLMKWNETRLKPQNE